MRRITLTILLGLVLAGCAGQNIPTGVPHERYTEAVKTVVFQLTQNALLTPSVTPTSTPEPTSTITLTPEPSPTVPSPTATWSYHTRGTIEAPILVYYHIADEASDYAGFNPEAVDQISPSVLQQHMTALREKGYVSITMDTLINTLLYGSEMPAKPIVITFDSTSEGIYSKAFPVLQAQGYIGMMFLTVQDIGKEGMLTVDQIKEMIQAGWGVGSHGMYGRDLTADHSTISEEISTSRLQLEELLGVPVTVFSYPYGRTDDVILTRISTWGYTAAVGLHWYDSTTHSTDYIYYLSRIEIRNDGSADGIISNLP